MENTNRIDMEPSIGAVMVADENELANLEGYAPGTIAFTAGYKKMWQLDFDGTWVTIVGGESDE